MCVGLCPWPFVYRLTSTMITSQIKITILTSANYTQLMRAFRNRRKKTTTWITFFPKALTGRGHHCGTYRSLLASHNQWSPNPQYLCLSNYCQSITIRISRKWEKLENNDISSSKRDRRRIEVKIVHATERSTTGVAPPHPVVVRRMPVTLFWVMQISDIASETLEPALWREKVFLVTKI